MVDHTEGPFTQLPTDNGIYILGQGQKHIATVLPFYAGLNRNVANANLFEAAPDLLAALKWLLEEVADSDVTEAQMWSAGLGGNFINGVVSARAAIAKAEGK